jgi:hypothetical protein
VEAGWLLGWLAGWLAGLQFYDVFEQILAVGSV